MNRRAQFRPIREGDYQDDEPTQRCWNCGADYFVPDKDEMCPYCRFDPCECEDEDDESEGDLYDADAGDD